MNALNRQEFSQMLSFMLAVIPTEDKTGKNCLFVKIENGVYWFTAGGDQCMKRVPLPSQTTIDKEGESTSFMIPLGALKAFSEIMKDHKSKCKKLEKGHENRLFIFISEDKLESFKEYVYFEQPDIQYKNLNPFFEQKQVSIGVCDFVLMSGETTAIMTGFSKTKEIESTHCTMNLDEKEVHLIHFKQNRGDDIEYEAVMLPPAEKPKEDGEQLEVGEGDE
jgi:hypothetical protein